MIRFLKYSCLFLGCIICFTAPEITKGQTYTLRQILDSISLNNPGLQQFALKTKESNAMSEAVQAWPAPQVGAGLSEFPYNTAKGANMMTPRKMLMIRGEQMLPNFSKQKADSKYYQSLAAQNNDEKETMKNELFAKAKEAYYDAWIAEKKETVIDEQIKQLQLLIKIAKNRLQYGKGDLPTIYNARSRISDLKSALIQLHSISQQAITVMNTLMNKTPDNPLQMDTTFQADQEMFPILQADSSFVLEHRSDIRLTGHNIESLNWKQKAALSSAKPTFGITWDNMRMTGNGYMYNLMAMVSIPIAPWSSKGYKSESRAINYQIQSLQKMKENQIIEAVGNIHRSWLELQAQQQDADIFKKEIIPAFQKTFHAYLNAFSENTGDIYKTLMAWNDVTMKRMEYLDKLGKLFQLKVALEKEMQIN